MKHHRNHDETGPKRLQVIVPISNYYGDHSYLECKCYDGGTKGRMFLIVQVEDSSVVDVDYGYRSLKHALKVAKASTERNGPVIKPKRSAILKPQRDPFGGV